MQTKVCGKCSEEKPISEFYKKKGGKYGVTGVCKECYSKRCSDYRANNKERIQEYNSGYYSENREHILEQKSDYYQKNKERISEQQSDYYQKNKERIREYNNRYYQDNREYLLKWMSDYYKRNKESILKRNSDYRQTEWGKLVMKNIDHIRRDQENNTPEDKLLTNDELKLVYDNKLICPYCGCLLTNENMSLDHITPYAKGGYHSLDNVVYCCRTCNSTKHAKSISDWMERCTLTNYFIIYVSDS